jgi:hypothetical protein
MKHGNDVESVPDIADKFVECAVECDEKLKKDIRNDLFACTNIYYNEKVQEDIKGFLLNLDILRLPPTPVS